MDCKNTLRVASGVARGRGNVPHLEIFSHRKYIENIKDCPNINPVTLPPPRKNPGYATGVSPTIADLGNSFGINHESPFASTG